MKLSLTINRLLQLPERPEPPHKTAKGLPALEDAGETASFLPDVHSLFVEYETAV